MRKRKKTIKQKPVMTKQVKEATKKIKLKRKYLVVNDKRTNIRVDTHDSFGKRFKGLMFRRSIPHNYGILLTNTKSIHMFFVKFPRDVIFTDKHGFVVSVFPNHSKKILKSQKDKGA
jgi:uncharacterized membrane protein (UPF0127 family)